MLACHDQVCAIEWDAPSLATKLVLLEQGTNSGLFSLLCSWDSQRQGTTINGDGLEPIVSMRCILVRGTES